MPRQPRIYSNTGIYHVMIRGINKEQIFSKGVYKHKVLNIIKEINQDVDYCNLSVQSVFNLNKEIKEKDYEVDK